MANEPPGHITNISRDFEAAERITTLMRIQIHLVALYQFFPVATMTSFTIQFLVVAMLLLITRWSRTRKLIAAFAANSDKISSITPASLAMADSPSSCRVLGLPKRSCQQVSRVWRIKPIDANMHFPNRPSGRQEVNQSF
jgi:hypothetical protein